MDETRGSAVTLLSEATSNSGHHDVTLVCFTAGLPQVSSRDSRICASSIGQLGKFWLYQGTLGAEGRRGNKDFPALT